MTPFNTTCGNYILIVDDDHDDHFFLRKAINESVSQPIVESVYDGNEALAYLENCATLPDLVFLDLNMVRVSGKETMRLIRQNEKLKSVPVIILTTSKNEKERDELLIMGANEFYSKPYSHDKLLNIVREVRDKWLVHV